VWEALASTTDLPSAVRLTNDRLCQPPGTGVVITAVRVGSAGEEEPHDGQVVAPIRRGRHVLGELHAAVDPAVRAERDFLDGLGRVFAPVIEREEVQRRLDRLAERHAMTSRMAAAAWVEAHRHIARVASGLNGTLHGDGASQARIGGLLSELAAAHRAIRRAEGGARYLTCDAGDLLASLRELAAEFGAATGISVVAQARGEPFRVDRAVEDALFALAVEWLLTAELDARASAVTVRLVYRPGDVVLAFRDDGVGLVHRPAFGTPWAVRSLQRAIEDDGGSFRIRNIAPRGVEVVASFRSEVRGQRV